MSTSLLYHAFGLKGIHHTASRFQGGTIVFEAEITRKLFVCPACQSREVTKEGSKVRKLKLFSMGLKPTSLHLTVYRLKCKKCGAIRWPNLHFADQKKDLPIPLPGL